MEFSSGSPCFSVSTYLLPRFCYRIILAYSNTTADDSLTSCSGAEGFPLSLAPLPPLPLPLASAASEAENNSSKILYSLVIQNNKMLCLNIMLEFLKLKMY